MGDSGFASKWNTVEAPNKIAALRPMMPTYNRAFALGAASMIYYKNTLLTCRDRCHFKVQIRFPNQKSENSVGVVGFKFKHPKEY